MNTDSIVTASSISSKIIALFIFIMVEIICNTLSFFLDINGKDGLLQPGAYNNPSMSTTQLIGFAMIG